MKLADQLAIQLSTAFGIGRIPVSPGTFGSLPGLALGAGIHALVLANVPEGPLRVGATVVILTVWFFIALWAIARMEHALDVHDDQRIVIDEVVGQAIAVAFVPPAFLTYFAAFALFRLLDIRKPWIIGRIDREGPGAWGTLGDDIVAGIVAGAVIYAVFRP